MNKIILLICAIIIGSYCFGQWQLIEPLPSGFSGFKGIQFVNNNTGFVCSYNGVGKTTDAGETWSFNTEHIGDFTEVQFINPDTGIICCDPVEGNEIMMTLNGGETWTFPNVEPYNFTVTDVAFLPDGKTLIVDCNSGGIVYLHTINDLYSAYSGTLPMLNGIYCFDMQFVNQDTGYIAGYFDSETGGDGSYTIRTNDGGLTWNNSLEIDGPDLGISFPSSKTGYGFSNNYHLWKTNNYADTWEELPWIFNEDIPGFTFTKVYFFNDSVGFVITQNGEPDHYEVLRTINAGVSWDTTLFETSEYDNTWFLDLFCTSSDTCYLTSTSGIFKTTNGAGLPVLPLSIYDGEINSFTLTPNPATSILNLQLALKENNYTIQTFNLVGELMPVNFQNNQADISHLPPGIYFTEVITEQGRAVQKWVKM
ncbi:MAG: T9SS type A sorting domain-containing protein [Bacteroidetes bacterium]|nr:T9SS type A sorting domain-containing protein [Bacteroidota bacterium]